MTFIFIFIATGISLCIFGANQLIKGASALARKLNVPPLIIGLTLVAFGTSLPELVVAVSASLKNSPDIILGNVLGSNAFNTLFILGVAALIYPLHVEHSTIKREIPFTIFMTLIFFLLVNDDLLISSGNNFLSKWDALFLLGLFTLYLILLLSSMKREPKKTLTSTSKETTVSVIIFQIVFGLAALIFGGELTVRYAIKLAETLHIGESLIAATIIAVGTSLPELVTSVYAAVRKEADIAIGNVLGSNIFNILLITGTSGMISGINFSRNHNIDLLFFCSGLFVLFIAMFTGTRKKLDRWEAGLLLFLYAGYFTWLLF
ncbi:MAG: calcium/sodium antiporter [Fibrobacteria bacterium]|nr:calcium/sodium antiporter [Fibrobacteria bacterium]